MAMTLAEYKLQSQDPLLQGVVQIFVDNAPILEYLSFDEINGGAVEYNTEATLPAASFRAINAKFTESSGTIVKAVEALTVIGGKIQLDRASRKMYGEERLQTDLTMKVKAMSRLFNETFYKGDGTSDSFEGLQERVTGDQIIANHATGGPLSLSKLREATTKTKGAQKFILCNESTFLAIGDAKNDQTLAGGIMISADEFGNQVTRFNGVEVIYAGVDTTGGEVLDFTEDAGVNSSIYVVSLDEAGVRGIQNGGIETIAVVENSAQSEVDVEWLVSMIVKNPRSAYRLSKITDAPAIK
jgi:hypothetical protein